MTPKSKIEEIAAATGAAQGVDLDITALTCPMTFVRVRLLVDRLSPGGTATVRLRGEEPLRNVPLQLQRLGHQVLAFAPEDAADPAGAWRLSLRRKG